MTTAKLTRRSMLGASAAFLSGCAGSSTKALLGDEVSSANVAPGGFALVELFTSQGCNSCPPADENLARIAREAETNRLPVYTLSFHVDYWNYLGWKDPYSKPAYSQRQRDYAKALRSNRVYTPQMIVNGNVVFVGSDRGRCTRSVSDALRQAKEAKLSVSLRPTNDGLQVAWKATGLQPRDVINLALVQNQTTRKVTAGENKGKTLEHANVVRDFRTVASPDANGTRQFPTPENWVADAFHVVAYIQSAGDREVRAATQAGVDSR